MIPRVKLSEKNETAVIDVLKPKNASTTVSSARKAFDEGRSKPIKFREAQLKQLCKMYAETEDEIIESLHKDMRKPKQECYLFEINVVKKDLKNVLSNFKSWVKPESVTKKIIYPLDSAAIYNDPLGVILIIGAWNYPIRACLLPIASAMAAGNCFILKPSSESINTCNFLKETLPKYLDQECYQVYTGDLKEILKERFDYIFYTGENYSGAHVAKAAAIYKTPTTLIIGGKNPVYLDDSTNMEIAARRIMWAKCVNSGQTCTGPEYLLCTKSSEMKFIEATEKVLQEFYTQDPKASPHYCRIVSEKRFEKLLTYLEAHTIALGGKYDKEERYIEPTILTDVNPNAAILEEAIYGPILPIVNIDNIQKAINFINAREKPLAMYIFSKNNKDVKLLLDSTSAGGVTVNDVLMHIACETLPFGGVGQSGMGSYHGKKTFDNFVHKKSVFARPQSSMWEKIETVRYPPYSETKTKFLTFAMQHRRDMPWRGLSYFVIFLFGIVITLIVMYCI